jgi:hypothetical protein
MFKCHALSLSLAALFVADPAAAQTATVAPLTVQSQASPKTIQRQTSRFVQSFAATASPKIEQIARWHQPVCVRIYGNLGPEQAAKIKARIEKKAEGLGLKPAIEGCVANVHILFTDQPQNALDIVAKEQGVALGYDHARKTPQLKAITHAIQSWYVTATKSDGVRTTGITDQNGNPFMVSFFQGNEVVDDPDTRPPAGCVSRFTACYASQFVNVLIVANTQVVGGQSLPLVADDITMLALSQPKSLDACAALPSVLDRFARTPCAGRDPPDGLTQADDAYLKALYAADPEGNNGVQHAAIAQRMAKNLINSDGLR